MKDTVVRMRANAFGRVEDLTVMVSDDGVRVYDHIAGHFTLCHSLCHSAKRRAVKLAAA